MLHIDAHFARGRSHTVCQDYAAVGPGVAVVCDGCSGAPDSDVGARLLAHAAVRAPPTALADGSWIQRTEAARELLGLGVAALDATCIVARASEQAIEVTMFGDGVVAARRLDGALSIIEVSFAQSAPPYPSYGLSDVRRQAYDRSGLGNPIVRETGPAPRVLAAPSRLSWRFPRAEWASVLVGSDGLAAFRQRDQTLAPASDVVPALFRYPSSRGRFVTRRLRKYLAKEAPSCGLHPEDDVAIAALCWSAA